MTTRSSPRRHLVVPLVVVALLLGLVVAGGPSLPRDPLPTADIEVDGGWTDPPPTVVGPEAARWLAVRALVTQGIRTADPRADVRWLPAFAMSRGELGAALREAVHRFPTVTLWRGDFAHAGACYAVVGQAAGAQLDPEALVRSARALPTSDPSGLAAHAEVLPFALYAGNAGRALAAIEAPLAGGTPLVGDALFAFEEDLRLAAPADEDPYLARLTDAERRSVSAGLALRELAVQLAALRHDAGRRALVRYVRSTFGVERPPASDWVR